MTKDVEGSEMTEVMKGASLRHLWAAGAAMVFLASSTQAFGTSGPPPAQSPGSVGTVVTVSGGARCDQFANGLEIIELKEDDPGPDFVLNGPDGQEIAAVVSNDTTLEWEATVPVDFVIVRAASTDDDDDDDDDSGFGRASHVYFFGDAPATVDRGETAPDRRRIEQIRFCYGLPQEPETLPRCADIEDGPRCPVDDEGVERDAVLVTFLFDERQFGGVPQCTCGEVVLTDCDENVRFDQPNSCAGGELQDIPVQIELIESITGSGETDCETVGSKRRCRKNQG